jgi:hypothetical protein
MVPPRLLLFFHVGSDILFIFVPCKSCFPFQLPIPQLEQQESRSPSKHHKPFFRATTTFPYSLAIPERRMVAPAVGWVPASR